MNGTPTSSSGRAGARRLDPITRVQFLPGVGPGRAQTFERLGITTLEQLVRHYPREWLDASRFVSVKDLAPGALLTVVGVVKHAAALRTRGGRGDFSVTVTDGTGPLPCSFFGQSFLARTLRPGVRVVVSGEWDAIDRRMSNPMFEVVEGDLEQLLHAGRLVPVHALTKGVSARGLRTALRHALDLAAAQVPDPVPAGISASRGLEPLAAALRAIHFPESQAELDRARRRLVFEELFLLQMVMELRRRVLSVEGRALALAGGGALAARVRTGLPFTLTDDQSAAVADVAADLAKPRPMHRLVIGDVGSGKTVVALLAAARVKIGRAHV
jgi:ATP-dependent DNA helicase RecG